MLKNLFLICFFCFLFVGSYSQNAYRIKADVTIKIRNRDSTFQFTKGTVRYDRNYKKIIFNITFPQKEDYVSIDTLIYKFQNGIIISTKGSPLKPEFSIFHFILNNDISDFGLRNSSYKATNVEKANDLIITKWTAPDAPKFPLGNIIVSSKDKKLETVIIYDKKGAILSRQIFKKYKFINGIEIPMEMLAVNYYNGAKTYQIMQFDKVLINEPGHDPEYDFQIPKNK